MTGGRTRMNGWKESRNYCKCKTEWQDRQKARNERKNINEKNTY